jgi:serine/threonine protein kinase
MMQIKSKHTVQCYGVRDCDPEYFIDMELCNSGDLRGLLKARGGQVSEAEAIMLSRQIVAGMDAMKKAEIIHRDLKLDNIMINCP